MENPFSALGACFTPTPTKSHSARTLRRSSPGLSMGVSRMNARPGNPCGPGPRRGCFRILPKAARPIFPWPIFSCRSTREPSGVFESFTCSTYTRLSPTMRSSASIVCVEPLLRPNVVACCKRVRRIDANSHRQIPGLIEDGFQFFKARADRRSHPRRIFQQYPQAAEFHSSAPLAACLARFR